MRDGSARSRRGCSMSQGASRSEEEAPTLAPGVLGDISTKGSSRAFRSEVTKDLDKFSQKQHFATNLGDENREISDDEKHPAKRKKFYIVADGEIPSELYRTDLLHRMKQEEDSDASSDDESAFVRMSDRWREEWNHGVQVPLYKKLPDFIVHDAPCPSSAVSRSDQQVSTGKDGLLISTHNRRYVGEKHKVVVMPKLRHYQADRADRLYLCKLNEKRVEVDLPEISEKTFGTIFDNLEVSCYQAIHYDLLSPLTSSVAPAYAEFDENACCDICRQPDYEEDDKIIFCDGCNLSVHQSCYGLDSVPPNEWLCQKCMLLGTSALPQCALCPLTGGAVKCTTDGETWAHVVCALWIHEVRFTDVVHREPIANICDIPFERWMLRCSICDTKQGACIQCYVETCTNAFHVSCALRSGQVMRIEHEIDNDDDDGVRMVSLCREHSLQMYPSPLMSFSSLDVLHAPALALQEMEWVFWLYVTVEDIANMLSISEDVVSDIYEYWKLRRIDSGYKPLLRDKWEVERCTVRRLQSSPAALLPVRLRNEATMRQNLERVRNLCYMVERREKTKLAALQCWIETYKSVYQTLTGKNVPYSNRALERFSNALSPIQQPLSDAVGVPSSPEDPSILSPLRACPLPESFPLRKLPAKHHIRERNGPSHYLRRNIMQRVSVSNSPKNSDEPLTSGHCSLRGFV